MQTIEQPDGRSQKRNDEKEEENPSFTSLFAERTAPLARSSVAVAFVLQRHRNVQAAAALARAHDQFFALTLLDFFGDARRVRNHPLELFHLVAQLRFLARQFLFRLIERGCRSRRTTKHSASPIE